MRKRGFAWIMVATFGITGIFAGAGDLRVVDAAKSQNNTAVRSLLKQRVDVNIPDVDGTTALHWAAHWDDFEMVRLLLVAGAKVSAANRYGVTPLHEACIVANTKIIEALLKAGADPNAAYGAGETPLMAAARSGHQGAVKLLIDAGANIKASEEWRGATALMYAVAENHAAVVQLLIDHGAEVNGHSITYSFPRDIKVAPGGGSLRDPFHGGLTPLQFAARQGAIESGGLLVAAGADVNEAEMQYGFTPMMTALFNGHYDFAAMLMDKGADVNDGSLYIAEEMRNLATYSNRPNPPEMDRTLTSFDAIRLLLDHGADPNKAYAKRIPYRQAQGDIRVPPGATPLYRATMSTDVPSIKLMIEKGANPNVSAKDHTTPLMIASGFGTRRADDEEVTDAAAKGNPLDAIDVLLKAGADINATNDAQNAAIHYAAQNGADRIVEALIERGARVDIKNRQGQTPAEVAPRSTVDLIRKLTNSRFQN